MRRQSISAHLVIRGALVRSQSGKETVGHDLRLPISERIPDYALCRLDVHFSARTVPIARRVSENGPVLQGIGYPHADRSNNQADAPYRRWTTGIGDPVSGSASASEAEYSITVQSRSRLLLLIILGSGANLLFGFTYGRRVQISISLKSSEAISAQRLEQTVNSPMGRFASIFKGAFYAGSDDRFD